MIIRFERFSTVRRTSFVTTFALLLLGVFLLSVRIEFVKGLIFGRCFCLGRFEFGSDNIFQRASILNNFRNIATSLCDDSNFVIALEGFQAFRQREFFQGCQFLNNFVCGGFSRTTSVPTISGDDIFFIVSFLKDLGKVATSLCDGSNL